MLGSDLSKLGFSLAAACCHRGVSRLTGAACEVSKPQDTLRPPERPGGTERAQGQRNHRPAQVAGTEVEGDQALQSPGLNAPKRLVISELTENHHGQLPFD